ncbi:MAG: L,D-transpeptidase [Jatrophihabitantaceae bacterium]
MTKPSMFARPPRPRRALGAIALLVSAAIILAGCGTGGAPDAEASPGRTLSASGENPSTTAPSTTAPSTSAKPKPATQPVHIKLTNSDGATYGVGMPIIAYFSRTITSAAALTKATTVTVDDKPVTGGWFFETSAAFKDYPIEGHWRPQNYWPAHSSVHLGLPIQGLSAGGSLAFDNSLTLDFTTGSANIATVDESTHELSLTVDGKAEGTYPVSLGATDTPTARGIKVIMEKGASICMSGPGYNECGVKWTQRLTYGGEYLHAAPWNLAHLGNYDSSNGCTNLSTSDAKKLYDLMEVGDVVNYPNANGPKMQLGTGYGDWNVPWSQWLTGGLVSTA